MRVLWYWLGGHVSPRSCTRRCSVPQADFVVPMEAVLDLYSQPYDARYPVICRDEQTKPLRADKRPPQPARPVQAIADHPRDRWAERLILVCDNLNTQYLYLLLPGVSADRSAPLGPARTDGVYAPARQLAPQGLIVAACSDDCGSRFTLNTTR